MRYHNLTIVGTSHIAKESLDEVRHAVAKHPDLIALELDKERLFALLGKVKREKLKLKHIKKIGFKGFLFSLLGEYAENKLGEQVGVKPGDEMKLAAQLAAQLQIPVVLIDQQITTTMRRFSEVLTWKEKWNFLVDVIKAIFTRKPMPFDLSKVPSKRVVQKLTKEVKQRYPNVYKVLVEERNEVMAKRLAKLIRDDPVRSILAIVGAGHEEELIELIKKELKHYSKSHKQ